MTELYYGLNVDYGSLLWEKFGTSISQKKLATGVSSARFWGLILREIYNQENILILVGIEFSEFPVMTAPRVFVDDATIFPKVAQITDSMHKLVDPKNQLLVQYLASIDSPNPIEVLPQKGVKGASKGMKATKKKKQIEKKQMLEE